MSIQKQDLFIDQGSDAEVRVELVNARTGSPLNLTGATAKAQVRLTPSSPNVAAEFACAIEGDPLNGVVTMKLTPTQTLSLSEQHYVYDLKLTYPDRVITPVGGYVNVFAEVTK